nr:unnamed protein product [Spirometra erinaceieuropaei]
MGPCISSDFVLNSVGGVRFHTMFRITCKILLNEANQLGEMRKNLVSRRKNVERQRKKLFKDIDGASNDLLSACRIAFLRAERRLDQLQAHSKAELSTVLDNQKLMELAIKLLQVAKNPAQKEDIQSLCKLRELALDAEETLRTVESPEFGNDPPTFEDFTLTNSLQTIGENLHSLNLLTPYGSAAAAAAAAATAANFHMQGSSAHQRSTALEPTTNPKASSRMAGVGNQQLAITKPTPPPPPSPRPKYQHDDCEQMVHCKPETLQHQQQQQQQQQIQQKEQQQQQQPQQSGQHLQSEQHRNDSHNYQTVDKSPRDLELYVDGLSAAITAETLKTHFDRFGEVLDVDMCTDSSTDEDSKNGAYITLRTKADPSQILETEHILCGVSINVEECESCDDSENDSECEAQSNTTECADQAGSAVQIYVDGVKGKITAENLRTYFAQFGEVLDVSLFMNSSTNRPCGGGYITLRPTCDVPTILRTKHIVRGSRINAREPVVGGKRPNPAATLDQEQQPLRSGQHQQSEQHRNDLHNYQTVDKSPRDLELYVDGLSAAITARTLKTHFDRFGEVLDIDMSTDEDNRNGAYITLRTTADPSQILETEHILCGVSINVEECESCDDSENDSECEAQSNTTECADQPGSAVQIYVDGVKGKITAENLRTYFAQFGEVLDVSLFMNSSTNRPCGGGYITLRPTCDVPTILRTKHIVRGSRINAREPVVGGKRPNPAATVKPDFELVPLLTEDNVKTMRQNVSSSTSPAQAHQLPQQKAGILR